MIARGLAVQFGTPLRAADEARFVIRRVAYQDVSGIYFPPDGPRRPRGALLVPSQGERERLLPVILGHHFLRHRTLAKYAYGADGPLFDAPREVAEALEFAREFLRHARQPVPLTRKAKLAG